jgi:hypothetical protein
VATRMRASAAYSQDTRRFTPERLTLADAKRRPRAMLEKGA